MEKYQIAELFFKLSLWVSLTDRLWYVEQSEELELIQVYDMKTVA